MTDACGHVYENLLPEAAPCAIETVTDGTPEPTTQIVHHVLSDGATSKKRKRTDGNSTSKNAARMRAKREGPEYRKRENKRREIQRRVERAREKKDSMLRIPKSSILSETTEEVCNRTGVGLKKYVIRKKVKHVEVSTFIHERVEEGDKENSDQVVVYRTEKSRIRRTWDSIKQIY